MFHRPSGGWASVGSTPPIDAGEAQILRAWLAWAGSRFDQPAGGPSTWDPEHVEYAFAAAGMGATSEAVLVAPEYVEGRLEWYDFEHDAGSLGATGTATPRRSFRIPAPLDFAGMPNPRFWTFEDPGVRFDQLEMLTKADAPPSPATLMVLDFALSYSDDWFLVPIALDAWTIFEITAVAITDVFGATPAASRARMTFANPAPSGTRPSTRSNQSRVSWSLSLSGGATNGLSPIQNEDRLPSPPVRSIRSS
jgi:hypothetical protein